MTTDKKADWAKAAPTKERTFRKIESDFFKFEKEGDSIEGYLVEKSQQAMRQQRDGTPNIIGKYKVQPEGKTDEELVSFLGGTDIDDKLRNVELNEYVRITFVGTERTSGGNSMKLYTVEVAD